MKNFKDDLYLLVMEKALMENKLKFPLDEGYRVEVLATNGTYSNPIEEYPNPLPTIDFTVTIYSKTEAIYRTIYKKISDISLETLMNLNEEDKREFINSKHGFIFKKRYVSPSYGYIAAAQDGPLPVEEDNYSLSSPDKEIQQLVNEELSSYKRR